MNKTESFEGLKGYVGVDLVLSDERVFVIEVNSRLTTSYIGLRNVSKINLAEAVTRAILNNESLTDFEIEGYSFFSKINLPNNPRLHSWICNFKELRHEDYFSFSCSGFIIYCCCC